VQLSTNIRHMTASRLLKRLQETFGRGVLYLLATSFALMLMFPAIWMVLSSVKTVADIYALPPRWIPTQIVWENYTEAWGLLPFGRFFLNSAIVTILSTAGTLVSSSLVAYGFSRFNVRGKDLLFMFVLGTMMLPDAATLVPRFILFSKLHWVDTFLPLVVPPWFGSPFFIFLFRQFFMSIPHDLDDAARIDGCGYLSVFFKVVIPLSGPAFATVFIFSFLWTWNDFLYPLVFLNSIEKLTAAIGLVFFRGANYTEWGYVMAMSTLATLPVVVLFTALQRYYVQGIAVTGIKA
jgi:multiple sugar transport system permease protein